MPLSGYIVEAAEYPVKEDNVSFCSHHITYLYKAGFYFCRPADPRKKFVFSLIFLLNLPIYLQSAYKPKGTVFCSICNATEDVDVHNL